MVTIEDLVCVSDVTEVRCNCWVHVGQTNKPIINVVLVCSDAGYVNTRSVTHIRTCAVDSHERKRDRCDGEGEVDR